MSTTILTLEEPSKTQTHRVSSFVKQGNYCVDLYTAIDDIGAEWDVFAKNNHPFYNRDFIGIAQQSKLKDFSFYYAIVKEKNEVVALFYFQVLNLKKDYYPNFSDFSFTAKNLYCLISSNSYNILINGHLFNTDVPGALFSPQYSNNSDLLLTYAKVVAAVKKISNSCVFLIKDANPIIQHYIKNELQKYKQMPDDVLMEIELPESWKSMDDYVRALSKKYAVRAKKLEQSIANFTLELLSADEIEKNSEQLNFLYQQVIARSSFKLGILNIDYFVGLKRTLADKFDFVAWKLNDEIVGFSTYIKLHNNMELYYIGLDYSVNRTHHLYHCMLQQGIHDAINQGKKKLNFGRTAYEAKAIAGAKPLIKTNFIYVSNPLLKLAYKYAANQFLAENNTNWQKRNPYL